MVFTLMPTKKNTHDNYIKFVKIKNFYRPRSYTNNQAINNLSYLFRDFEKDVNRFVSYLKNPDYSSYGGSLSTLRFIDEKLFLEPSPLMATDKEDEATEIDIKTLLRLAQEWDALVKKEVPEIYISQLPDGTLQVTNYLPKGVE